MKIFTPPYSSKFSWMKSYLINKSVLDIGCVQHDLSQVDNERWLHRKIQNVCAQLTGLDILEKEVQELKNRGYHVFVGDAESFSLGQSFDIVVAGDIIEHLANPGVFLLRAKDHLNEQGTLLVSTPNPLTLPRFLRLILLGRAGGNEEHTLWFTRKVFNQLATRQGFIIKEISYVDDIYQWYKNLPWPLYLLSLPLLMVNFILCRFRPELSETYCYALQKQSVV